MDGYSPGAGLHSTARPRQLDSAPELGRGAAWAARVTPHLAALRFALAPTAWAVATDDDGAALLD